VTPLSALTPVDGSGLRSGSQGNGVAVKNPSRLVYDINGHGFTRFRGTVALENPRDEIGATLNPQVRFYVFDAEPDMQRLTPPEAGSPLPAAPKLETIEAAVDRVFWHALGRAPTADERRVAAAAVDDGSGNPSSDGLADLLWAVMMTPEFQFVR
jgi:hypothetical protein